MKKILPILIALIGTGTGVGAGFFNKSNQVSNEATEYACGPSSDGDLVMEEPDSVDSSDFEYAKLNNQFVVPVVTDGRVQNLVILTLSIEVAPGEKETVYQREPKLRDAFIQTLFNHANIGGFAGEFTNSNTMDILRHELLVSAKDVFGNLAKDVLIIEIMRQDV
ncbi:flagellar basal body-associated FliL family protein [Thalassobium sp. R2A62]|jgi:hypothetical protein|uniref:flagellar basal body-associated FliL family protein n=1 Tax=Thalassobium sp. R2A62 TaxID=633131 RepID=UPI0001B1D039|nr:flagellar basal body-associated FliL family protein [Thalassobium sp. R2A62]EET47090.1 flagellar basal body-associated protein FliL [Thalassobium sp. R2A62]